jgi:hypothetical protein
VKVLRQVLPLLLLASPLTAFAHGEEVLVTVFLQFAVLVILAIGLVTANLKARGKLIVGSIGTIALVLTSIATNGVPYMEYRTMINISIVAVPLTVVTISYLALKVSLKGIEQTTTA